MNAFYAILVMLANDALVPGNHVRTLSVGGLKRSYIVHIPNKYDAKRPTPVVLAFHGGGGNAEQMMAYCGLNQKADSLALLSSTQMEQVGWKEC